jgi:hypothetical protein
MSDLVKDLKKAIKIAKQNKDYLRVDTLKYKQRLLKQKICALYQQRN